MNMYLLMPVMGRDAVDATVGRPSVLLRDTMLQRMRKLLRSPVEVVTYVPWTSAKACVAAGPWPAEVWFPTDMSTAPTVSFLHKLSRYALATMVQQQPVQQDVAVKLCEIGLIEHRNPQTLANERVIGRLKADCPSELRAAKPAATAGRRAPGGSQ